MLPQPEALKQLLNQLYQAGLRPVIVGGAVRDFYLGLPIKEWDIEVFGPIDIQELHQKLLTFAPCQVVGKAFGVIKIPSLNADFSLPRTEEKQGPGHRGFSVMVSGEIPFKVAASRRDFTINSMGICPITNELHDPFGGLADLHQSVLRHVGEAFCEDPLRVLRAVQFSARFNFQVAQETREICQSMAMSLFELPKERLWGEFKKWLLAPFPGRGLRTAREIYALHVFPELAALIDIPQDAQFHPEGDAWEHTILVLDAMVAQKTGDLHIDLILMMAALCHDIGKPNTTRYLEKNGEWHWRSRRHDQVGGKVTRRFLRRLINEEALIDHIVSLVKNHMNPFQLWQSKADDSAILRLSTRVNIEWLCRLVLADSNGRKNLESERIGREVVAWLLEKSERLQVLNGPPTPLISGKDVVALGIQPGPDVGEFLTAIFNQQLKGKLTTREDALAYLEKKLKYFNK